MDNIVYGVLSKELIATKNQMVTMEKRLAEKYNEVEDLKSLLTLMSNKVSSLEELGVKIPGVETSFKDLSL